MTNRLVPPTALLQEWFDCKIGHPNWDTNKHIATDIATWAANYELDACCEWLIAGSPINGCRQAKRLRVARRPKPLSLKKQALDQCNDYIDPDGIIRRALEALPDAD